MQRLCLWQRPYWWRAMMRWPCNLVCSAALFDDPVMIAALAGNGNWPGFEPVALAYSGHQFGHWNPMMGDGRAHLIATLDSGFEVHLKGSGATPFSRNGDGRAALGPMLREYIVSEAFAGLGIPTTRTLVGGGHGRTGLSPPPGTGCDHGARGEKPCACRHVSNLQRPMWGRKVWPPFLRMSGAQPPAGRQPTQLSGQRDCAAGEADCAMDVRGLHPWRDEHRQHGNIWRDH